MIFYRWKEVAMGPTIRTLIFTCIALFGLRGLLPDVVNKYGFTALFLVAMVIVPLAGMAAHKIISSAQRKAQERKQRLQQSS